MPVSLRLCLWLSLSSCSLVGYEAHDTRVDLTGSDAGNDLDASRGDDDARIEPLADGATTVDSGERDAEGTAVGPDARTGEPEDASDRDAGDSTSADATAADAGRVDAGPTEELPPLPNPEPDAGFADAAVSDAGVRDAALPATDGGLADGSVAPCAGSPVLGMCWYLGAWGASCNRACLNHGGNDARQASMVGTSAQGGSRANCSKVLAALRVPVAPLRAYRTDNLGVSCVFWADGNAYWLDPVPVYNMHAASAAGRVACACLR